MLDRRRREGAQSRHRARPHAGDVLLALLVLIAACGGGTDGDVDATPTPSPMATPTLAPVQSRLWAIGQTGDARVLIRSDDGGRSWSAPLLAGASLTAPSFLDHENGWIADGQRFLRSHDGGDTWSDLRATVTLPPPADGSTALRLGDVAALIALDDARAIAVGSASALGSEPGAGTTGIVLLSDDGGLSWQGTHLGLPYRELCATTAGVALAYGATEQLSTAVPLAASIEASRDGGVSWQTIAHEESIVPGAVRVGAPVCADGTLAWRVGSRPLIPSGNAYAPRILYTPDAGATWTDQSDHLDPPLDQASLAAGSFASPSVGWAVGSRAAAAGASTPVVVHTRDGGTRWKVQDVPEVDGSLRSVAALDEQRAVGVGTRVVDRFPEIRQALVVLTEDGGTTWSSVPLERAIEAMTAVVAARRRHD